MENKLQVVVADPMHEEGIALLKRHFATEVFSPAQKEQCLEAILKADAVVVRTFVVDSELMAASPRLKTVVKHGAGVDNIDIPAASARGIVVANTGDANAESVAEATVSLMFASLRKTAPLHVAMTQGKYDIRWGLLLEGICDKTLGLVGFGNIGRRVAAMCRGGFRMNVIAFDPHQTAEQIAVGGARKVDSLNELLATSDIVSLHASMKHGDKPLIGVAELAHMKPRSIIVNTARGGLIDERALAEALRNGQLYGAGLDVLESEPPAADNPLFALESAVLTPHVGGATESTRRLMARRAAEAVISTLQGQTPEFWLNKEASRHLANGKLPSGLNAIF